jgi:membrane associated rhomboid family serine protease
VIPLRDSVPHERTPLVTISLIVACTLVYLYEARLAPWSMEVLFSLGGLVPRALFEPEAIDRVLGEIWSRTADLPRGERREAQEVLQWAAQSGPRLGPATILTSMFLHGSFAHLLGNMWFLWLFGDNVEDRMGHLRFLVFYLLCGLGAAGLHVALDPHSLVPTVGASGAIAGVLGAYFLLFPRARVLTLVPLLFVLTTAAIPAVVFIGLWFVFQWLGATQAIFQPTGMGGIAYGAHVGGFLAGLVLVWLFKRRRPTGRRVTYYIR